jgi:maltooligosyltrehalose trehalohydrolase
MGADFRPTYGAHVDGDRGVLFRVWAPRARSISVKITAPIETLNEMDPQDRGVFETFVPRIGAGTDYLYVIDGERERPDPMSRFQPHGVHGPSRVIDPRTFAWHDGDWRGLSLEKQVFYELHVGTFTPKGTFEAVIPKLAYLRELGITAVEVMPVAQFPGSRNWGYDGVSLFAPQSSYGGPEGLKRLVDACHREALAFVIDVVYNHFGPEGNYLGEFGPYFSERYRTPWGDAVNYDGPDSDEVRRFVIENALYWLTEFHADALRLDAIHGIFDFSGRHILEEMQSLFQEQARRLGRRAHLIAESDLNDARVIKPVEAGGHGLDAQWSDDFHHAVHAFVADARRGYLGDFGRLDDVQKAMQKGFVYDGRYSTYRRRRHGNSAADRPGRQFVVCVQNHDQVANGAQGERHGTQLNLGQQKVVAGLLFLAPNLPLLFMGQEFGETAPFDYFVSHYDPDLVEAVRAGRRREFESFGWEREFPDPQDEQTFARCRLGWDRLERMPHAGLLEFYRALIRLRQRRDSLSNCRKDLTWVRCDEKERWLTVERGDPEDAWALGVFNLSTRPSAVPCRVGAGVWELAIDSSDPAFGEASEPANAPRRFEHREGSTTTVPLPAWSMALYFQGR